MRSLHNFYEMLYRRTIGVDCIKGTNLQTVLFVTMVRASIGEELRPGYVCGYISII